MNRLPIAKRAHILNLLVEGNSLRAASRIADVSINTVYKLAIDAGEACSAYQDQAFRNLPCRRIQLDEIWSFVYTKQRNVILAKAAPEIAGDVWTWVAICADTKLVPSRRVSELMSITPSSSSFMARVRILRGVTARPRSKGQKHIAAPAIRTQSTFRR